MTEIELFADTEFLAADREDRSELRRLVNASHQVLVCPGEVYRVRLNGFKIYVGEGLVLTPRGVEFDLEQEDRT